MQTSLVKWWKKERKGYSVLELELTEWLEHHKFAQFRSGKGRLAGTEYFKNDDNVLRIHDTQSVRDWIVGVVKTGDDAFLPKNTDERREVLRAISALSLSILETRVLKNLPIYTTDGDGDTRILNIFKDRADQAKIGRAHV